MQRRLMLEELEAREVPAVTVRAGLGLIGNPTDLDLIVTGTSASEAVQITSGDDVVDDIIINALEGTTLQLDSETPSDLVDTSSPTQIRLRAVPRDEGQWYNIKIDMKGGNDIIKVDELEIKGGMSIYPGVGNDKVQIYYVFMRDSNGNLVIRDPGPTVNDGNDVIRIDPVLTQETTVQFFKGDDRLYIKDSQFEKLSFYGGAGNDVIRFLSRLSQVDADLLIATQGGHDRVFVDASASPGVPVLSVFAGLTRIDTHGGDDIIRFGTGTGTGLSVDLKDVDIDTGTGNDSLYIRDAIMQYYLRVLLGGGNDKVLNNWGAANMTVGSSGPGSLLDGGAGTDSLPTGWTAPTNLVVVHFP